MSTSNLDINSSSKSLQKALQKILTEVAYDEFMYEVEHGDYSRFPQDIHYLFEKWMDRKRPKPSYVFITLNLKDDLFFPSFIQRISKSVLKKWIVWYVYAFEQRSQSGPEYGGYHVHMLINRGQKSPSLVKNEFKTTFRQLIATDNPHCLNFKFIDYSVIDQKIDYILGEKQSKKLALVDRDREMRKFFLLDDHYCSESSPCPCRNSKTEEENDDFISDIPVSNAISQEKDIFEETEASTSADRNSYDGCPDGIEST